MFKQLQRYDGGYVTFGDNATRKIIGVGKIENNDVDQYEIKQNTTEMVSMQFLKKKIHL